jgi:DNA-binding MarR family transcriptional regulator
MTVGLLLLSRLQVDTSAWISSADMLVVGLGIGSVMQVLVLAAQNAVDYKYLGVVTSGSTLFRSIGGSIGVSVFGAIFANQLTSNLAGKLPPGTPAPTAANPAAVKRLPPAVHDVYVTAVTASLRPIFLAAAGAAAVGFALAWLLREIPLRTTAQADGIGEGFASPRDNDAIREIERALSLLASREHRWELYQRLAARAGVDLPPPQLWLLARLGERVPVSEQQLLDQPPVDGGRVAAALGQLLEQSLVRSQDGLITLTASGREAYERLVAARCAGLREHLAGWDPDEHPELRQLIDKLGRDLVSQIPPGPRRGLSALGLGQPSSGRATHDAWRRPNGTNIHGVFCPVRL